MARVWAPRSGPGSARGDIACRRDGRLAGLAGRGGPHLDVVLIVVSVATDERVPAAAAGPAVGFTLAAAILAGGPVTGGAVNPARALGPMIMAGTFTSAWVYMVAPVVGGILAAWLYDRFLAEADTPTS